MTEEHLKDRQLDVSCRGITPIQTELSRSFPGAFLKLEYIAVTDAYYQHWVETEGSGVKFHHVCRSALSSCK